MTEKKGEHTERDRPQPSRQHKNPPEFVEDSWPPGTTTVDIDHPPPKPRNPTQQPLKK
jgi:hypothetical protein